MVWEGKKNVVTVNDTRLLDRSAVQELPIARKFSCVFIWQRDSCMFSKDYCSGGVSWSVSKTNNVHYKQCATPTKLWLPQSNWVNDTSPPQ